MIDRIDVLKSKDIDCILADWRSVVYNAVRDKNAIFSQFLKVYRRIHQPGYEAVSRITFHNEKSAAPFEPVLGKIFGSASGNSPCLYRSINEGQGASASSDDGMMIVNPYRINARSAASNATMWNETKEMMKNQDGFVSAKLFETITPAEDEYHFVSIAEWVSEAAFQAPFSGSDYQRIVESYHDKFQICFTKLACEINENNIK